MKKACESSESRLIGIQNLLASAALSRAEASKADAMASCEIMQLVAALGGMPGKDGVCLRCGELVREGSVHEC